MGKFCENCLKKYDDAQDTCLMCGGKLVPEEACKEVCAKEGLDVKEVMSSRVSRTTLIFAGIILFIAVTVTVLVLRHNEYLDSLTARQGTYPHSQEEK